MSERETVEAWAETIKAERCCNQREEDEIDAERNAILAALQAGQRVNPVSERDLIARFETAVVRWHEASLTDELEEYRAAHSALLAALQAGQREPDGWVVLSKFHDEQTENPIVASSRKRKYVEKYAHDGADPDRSLVPVYFGTPPRESGEYDPEGLERAVQEYLEGMKYPDVRSHAIGIVKAYRGDRVDRAAHPPDFRSE